ncbi:hypothetical protein B0T25DRAFT_530539 [Lasiosphaeria hispida]|uniref:Uncharacterized protein n=1 Tax=Lasiosphaeria hispida TaxID=260671 RepID=A0AAJ0HXR3_9PEZI|nr:hypothetical protein B0T25DRAFT_530539 [Lasiosphaeria hispida]
MKNLLRSRHSNTIADTDSRFLQAWLTIVEYYSAYQFTFETDRLPAILGLADRLGQLTVRTYIGGNWFLPGSPEIPPSLLWVALRGLRNRQPT